MPRYFTHLDQTNQPANALQRAAARLLDDSSNLLIEDLGGFTRGLKTTIEKLNLDHPRCTPLCFSTFKSDSERTCVYLGGHFTVAFYIDRVRETEEVAA